MGSPLPWTTRSSLPSSSLPSSMASGTPRVQFTRYEVLRILGWKDVGKNYVRIEEA